MSDRRGFPRNTIDNNTVDSVEAENYIPFPVDALPDPLSHFVSTGAEAIGCDPAFIALPFLVAVGSDIGNSRRLFVKRTWYSPPIFFTPIIGESGTQKTPAFRMAMKPLREMQSKQFEVHRMAMIEFELAQLEYDQAKMRGRIRNEAKSLLPDIKTPE